METLEGIFGGSVPSRVDDAVQRLELVVGLGPAGLLLGHHDGGPRVRMLDSLDGVKIEVVRENFMNWSN